MRWWWAWRSPAFPPNGAGWRSCWVWAAPRCCALRAARRTHGDGGARKTLRQAMTQIIAADLSMSLDNVLAVAGAAHGHPWVLVCGLCLSVVLMAAAATAIARLLDRFRWIGWVGLVIVLHVALSMIWDGW